MNGPNLIPEEELRNLLRPGSAPDDLRRGLLSEARRKDRSHRLHAWALAAAACLVLVLSGLGAWRSFLMDPAPGLARLAYEEYRTVQRVDFSGEPPMQGMDCCTEWSRRCAGFDAPLPSCVEHGCVRGGRVCRIGKSQAACYLLDGGRALYVLPKPIRGQPGRPGKAHPLPSFGHAHVWNEGGLGYVLLESGPA